MVAAMISSSGRPIHFSAGANTSSSIDLRSSSKNSGLRTGQRQAPATLPPLPSTDQPSHSYSSIEKQPNRGAGFCTAVLR
jgi:hypothetical protein